MLMAVNEPYALMVQPDDILISPREVDEHFGTMVCFHPRYALGDHHNYMDKDDFLREMYLDTVGLSLIHIYADVTLPLSVSELREAADGQLSMFNEGRSSVLEKLSVAKTQEKTPTTPGTAMKKKEDIQL